MHILLNSICHMNKDDDPLRFLKNQLSEVETETRKESGDDWSLWIDHYNTWMDVNDSVLNVISEYEQGNSMLVFRLLELQKTLLWLQICASYGAYHQLIRELRFILDSFAQAHYLDKNFQENAILEKLDIVEKEELELFGRKLISKLDLNQQDELKRIYGVLSKYEHSTYEEMKSAIQEGNVDVRILFTFDKDLFHKCKDFTNEVMDATFYLVLDNFPQAVSKLKSDKMTIYWLKELDSKLTLQLIDQC